MYCCNAAGKGGNFTNLANQCREGRDRQSVISLRPAAAAVTAPASRTNGNIVMDADRPLFLLSCACVSRYTHVFTTFSARATACSCSAIVASSHKRAKWKATAACPRTRTSVCGGRLSLLPRLPLPPIPPCLPHASVAVNYTRTSAPRQPRHVSNSSRSPP